TVDPLFEKAVYSQSYMEIAEGDRLKWTKNDRKLGRRNGQEFKVREIQENTALIEYQDGSKEHICLNDTKHLDYAIVSTTYSSQGKTADRVLISADFTIGKESFYVAVSRVKYDLKLYTSDKADLLERAKESRAKENVLEILEPLRRKTKFLKETAAESIAPVQPTFFPVTALMPQPSLTSTKLAQQPNPLAEPSEKSERLESLDTLERQKQLYRLTYEELSRQVRQIPGFKTSPTEKVDIGVAMFVLLESEDSNEVRRVLSQSDRVLDVLEGKKSLPEAEYQAKLVEYLFKTHAQAQELLRQPNSQRLAQQNPQALDLER
ncbi:MAG: hypothetical protein ACRDEA_21245, partial [Microcystaceae cyanobacterium]